jgi:hypothetical protein
MSRKYALFCLMLLGAYAGTYLALTLRGVYMPVTYGATGIKDWGWAPQGFRDDSGTCRWVFYTAYWPLWRLDSRYCHDDWSGLTGPQKIPPPRPRPKKT